MHARGRTSCGHFRSCWAYETAFGLRRQGRIRHGGISSHDTADYLERILTDYPEIEVVQIQLNYPDYDNTAVQSGKCLELCRRHHKPVIVMEPVKGVGIVNLPEDAEKILSGLHAGSSASCAIRFAAGLEGIMMVLPGMSSMEQM